MGRQKAIYPGSFDPVTNGHLDLIKRARMLFDEIFVVVSVNPEKETLFNVDERVDFIKRAVKPMKGVRVERFEGLTVDCARAKKAGIIIRGLRATSDFDFEFQMALTNRKLSKKVDTIFLMPSESLFYLSSRLIKQIASLKGDISNYVPGFVAKRIYEKMFS